MTLTALAALAALAALLPRQGPARYGPQQRAGRPQPLLDLLRTAWRPHRGGVDQRSVAWALSIASSIRGGTDTRAALASACKRYDVTPRTQRALEQGHDATAALRLDAADTGNSLIGSIAAVWPVHLTTGAELSNTLESLADSHRATSRAHRQVDVDLAEPMATARLMTALPVVGIALGYLMGADPIHWLLGSGQGLVTMTLGLSLNALGSAWSNSLSRRMKARL